MTQKYYWIKLKTDFFSLAEIEWLLSQKNGAEYVVLYQMLCLMTANSEGRLSTKIGEMIVPYDIGKIVRDCKHFDYDTVSVAMQLFMRLGLIYEQDDKTLRITSAEQLVGAETQYAQQKRAQRAVSQKVISSGQCPDNVPTMSDKRLEYRDKSIDTDTREKNEPPKPPKGDDERFNTFWSSYPKKVSKETAKKAFAKIKLTDVLMAEILCALEKYKLTEQWTKDNGQYIPNPTTWLNQKRWEDEIQEVAHGENARDNAAHSKTSPFEYLSTAF